MTLQPDPRPACPADAAHKVVRFGKLSTGRTAWWCPACRRRVSHLEAPWQKTPTSRIVEAMTLYFNGTSFGGLKQVFNDLHGQNMTRMTFWRWLVKYAQRGIDYMNAQRPCLGGVWVADETAVFIGGKQWWYWDVIDVETRYLLATHLSRSRGSWRAEELFQSAKARAGGAPSRILTDGLKDYGPAIQMVFGTRRIHVTTQGFGSPTNTNLIERFHGTLKQRIKVMRNFKKAKPASILLDGFIVHYNFLREHETLGTTPARAAGIGQDIRNWGDLIRLGKTKANPPIEVGRNLLPTEWTL